jgi:autotransporter-associated beta strand protein
VLANNVNVNANLSVAGNNNLTLGGVIAGAGTLTKNGLADLTLTGNNTFSGTFDVQSGSLTTLGNSALGSNAGSISARRDAQPRRLRQPRQPDRQRHGTDRRRQHLEHRRQQRQQHLRRCPHRHGGLSKLGTGTLTLTGSTA